MKKVDWGTCHDVENEALFLLKENYDITPKGIRIMPSGRINLTFQVESEDGEKLIFQRLNPIFKASPALGDNWAKVSSVMEANGLGFPRLIVNSLGDKLTWSEDTVWRLTSFIEGSVPEASLEAAYRAGKALGAAHSALNKPMPIELYPLPAGVEYTNQKLPMKQDFDDFARLYRLHPLLPRLEKTLEIAGIEALRLPGSPAFQRVFFIRDLVIHGDPKKDNYLSQGESFVLIDWDTVSYGDPLIDIAELIRSFASNKEKPFFSADLAERALAGYREEGLELEKSHYRLLPSVIRGVSLTLARRYLADSLLDIYFSWEKSYPSHFDQCLTRAKSILDLVHELWERDFELWDL
jgi:Ser/Thr protein kinase RdoA (MazF antagonist)